MAHSLRSPLICNNHCIAAQSKGWRVSLRIQLYQHEWSNGTVFMQTHQQHPQKKNRHDCHSVPGGKHQHKVTTKVRWTVVDHATALCILTGELFDSCDSVLTQVCLVFLCYQKAAEHPLPNMPWFACTFGLAWDSQTTTQFEPHTQA